MPFMLLTAGEAALVKVLIVVAVVVLGMLNKWRFGRKTQQEQQQQPTRRPPAQSPTRPHPARPAPPLPQRQSMTGDSFSQPSERRIPQQQRTARPGFSVEEHVRTVRDQTDLDVVDEVEERRRQEMEQKDALRLRRLQTAAPAEADTAAIDARISHFQRMEVQQDQVARVQVNLASRRTLRDAIIFHEILSPPKALRNTPEMWDQ
jgi:hypothetical protein